MSLYAIADLHLSLGEPEKTMEVFPGWRDYVARTEKNWRRFVTDRDTVVIAGDVSWAMTLDEALEDLRFIDALPGKKILSRGNHDYWWSTMAKMEAFVDDNALTTLSFLHNNAIPVCQVAVCGSRGWFFDSEGEQDKKIIAREAGRLSMSLDAAGELGLEPVVFLHYPPVSVGGGRNEIIDLLERRGVKRVCYGHLHGEKTDRCRAVYDGTISFSLIAADYLDFAPLLIQKGE